MEQSNKIVVVVKGIVVNEGHVLIVQRAAADEIGSGTWECVGGKLEFGEDLEASLIREIYEEAGLTVTINRILYATTFNTNPFRQVVLLTYLCESVKRNVTLSSEHQNHLWASKEEMKRLLAPGILHDFEKHNVFSCAEIN